MGATTEPGAAVAAGVSAWVRPAERLLRTATKLFAEQGIRAVGVDQILREAGVAKASLYSAYGSKDALVLAYLDSLDHADRKRWTDAVAAVDGPVEKALTFFDLAVVGAQTRDFRGCLYANAATEYPGVDLEPVRAHRRWLLDTVTGLLSDAGIAGPAEIGREFQLLYDGALVGSKVERSTAPILLARQLAVRRILGG